MERTLESCEEVLEVLFFFFFVFVGGAFTSAETFANSLLIEVNLGESDCILLEESLDIEGKDTLGETWEGLLRL